MQQTQKRILITGCNRGLGLHLANLITQTQPSIVPHCTSRLDPTKLSQLFSSHNNPQCYQLDITDTQATTDLANSLKKNKQTFSAIVANAAVGYDGGGSMPSPQLAQKTMKTNVDSTIHFVNSFLPLLEENGRVVVIASEMAALRVQPTKMREILSNPKITEEEILNLSKEYVQAAKNRQMKNYHLSAYGTSKAFISAWARFVLKKKLQSNQSFVCMHPGWCSTDMGGSYAPVDPRIGAERMLKTCLMTELKDDMFYSQNKWVTYFECQ